VIFFWSLLFQTLSGLTATNWIVLTVFVVFVTLSAGLTLILEELNPLPLDPLDWEKAEVVAAARMREVTRALVGFMIC
jgi:hypothetical protein